METRKKNIIIALMVGMFLGAVEGTVVTTAIPTIIKDLHGFQIISLVFSVYLLTSAISTPIYGKLADLYGRKHILSIGIIIFLVGSFLCGLAPTIYLLIAFRALQGLGTGALITIPYTIIGDIFSIEERPAIQGIISAVWGIASLVGPFLGGILIDTLSWHWIFFINIPFGILSIILLQKNLQENYTKKKHQFDFSGILTLTLSMLIFMNLFLTKYNFNLNQQIFTIISVSLTIVFLLVFYGIERKAKEPIIHFEIFTKTTILVNVIGFLVATILIGISVYMPIYNQNVLGFSATKSGVLLAPMSFAWLLASITLGKAIVKYGMRLALIVSHLFLLSGVLLLTTLNINSISFFIALYVFVIGFGFGGAFTIITIMIQESVTYQKRGSAVATNSLLRTLGQTIGISLFGSFFNLYIIQYLVEQGITGVQPNDLYNDKNTNIAIDMNQVKQALNSSLHVLFYIFIGIAAFSLILSVIIPKIKHEK